MNKALLTNVGVGVLSFTVGSVVFYALATRKANKSKPKIIYAGNVLCVANTNTKEIDLYLQIQSELNDIINQDAVMFKVKKKFISPEETIAKA